MNDLDKYLGTIKPLAGFKVGDYGVPASFGEIQGAFFENGRPREGAEIALSTMRIAWAALPDEIKQRALDMLTNLLGKITDGIDGVLESIPFVGDIVAALVDLGFASAELHKQLTRINDEYSGVSKNHAQYYQLGAQTHPTQWIYTSQEIALYNDTRCTKGSRQCLRKRPSFVPVGQDTVVVGWDRLPTATGSCDDGKEYSHVGAFLDLDKMKPVSDSAPCKAYGLYSALYFPFWSPNAAASWSSDQVSVTDPIQVYVPTKDTEFNYTLRDPNGLLVDRQLLLLSSPILNLQADASRAKKRLDAFLKWWKLNVHHKIDSSFKDINEAHWTGTPFWTDDNGLLVVYDAAAREGYSLNTGLIRTADWGKAYSWGTRKPIVTAGAYNCVVGMTRAFFTARAGFLRNTGAMKSYTEKVNGIRLVDSFDSAVRSAVKAAAVPARAKAPPPPRQQSPGRSSGSGGGGGGIVLVGGAALALALLRKR